MKLLNTCIRKNRKGFTFIEILAILGILSIIAGFGLLVSMDFWRSFSFRSERTIAVAVFQKARTQAMVNMDEKPHGVRVEPARYTIFEGASWATRTLALDEVIQAQPTIIITCSPACTSASPLDVVFNQLDGSVAASGTVTISDGVRLANISLNSEGRIDW